MLQFAIQPAMPEDDPNMSIESENPQTGFVVVEKGEGGKVHSVRDDDDTLPFEDLVKPEIERQKKDFLRIERWNSELPAGRIEGFGSSFTDSMTDSEKEIQGYREEILKAAHYKRNKVPDMETYADPLENPLSGLKGTELKTLYQKMPGFRKHLEYWAGLLENPEQFTVQTRRKKDDGRTNKISITIHEAIDREEEVEPFRKYVENKVANDLIRGLRALPKHSSLNDEDLGKLATKLSIDSGQTAFNLLYSLNFFEGGDQKWVDSVRVRPPKLKAGGDLAHEKMIQAMNPLDTLLTKAKEGKEYWVLGDWAVKNIPPASKYDKVKILPSSKKDSKHFWKVRNGVLLIPEAYPIQTIGSYFDVTKDRGKTLRERLVENDEIDWGFLGDSINAYLKLCKQASNYDKYTRGDTGKDGFSTEAANIFLGALNQDSLTRRQWLVLTASGHPHTLDPAPKLRDDGGFLSFYNPKIVTLRRFDLEFIPKNKGDVLFPWDKEPLIYKLI